MGIQAHFIDKKIKKTLVKNRKLQEFGDLSKIDKIAILVDEHIAFNDAEFVKLQQLMQLDHTHFNIITYKERKSNFNEFRGTVVLSTDINWQGKITSKDVLHTLAQDYDLLIDYTQADKQHQQLIVALCKARLKVGFMDKKDDLYNFMISVNPSKIGLFNQELVRYLKILKLL